MRIGLPKWFRSPAWWVVTPVRLGVLLGGNVSFAVLNLFCLIVTGHFWFGALFAIHGYIAHNLWKDLDNIWAMLKEMEGRADVQNRG